MISRIHLTNFRRHADTGVTFGDERLILIDGPNGAGKSTLVEALLWALYGEGRDGRADQDRLVRRGGEDEGMKVEVDLEISGDMYTIVRSRQRSHSRAEMHGPGGLIAAAPSAVTAQVTALLGVDAAGFRLAVYAQQNELDALGSLQPARRAAMLGRLIGLDAVTAARADAIAEGRAARARLEDVDGTRLDSAAAEEAEATAEHVRLTALLEDARKEQAQAAQTAAALAAEQAAYLKAEAEARAEQAAAELAGRRLKQLEQQAEELRRTAGQAAPGVEHDIDVLTDRALEATRAVQQAEEDHRLHGQRAALEAELSDAEKDLHEVIVKVDRLREMAGRKTAAAKAAAAASRKAGEARSAALAARDKVSRLRQQHADAEGHMNDIHDGAGVCRSCGSQVTEEQAAAHAATIRGELARLAGLAGDAERRLVAAEKAADEADVTAGRTAERAQEAEQAEAALADAVHQEETLRARHARTAATLQRTPAAPVNLQAAREAADEAAEALRQARAARGAAAAASQAASRLAAVTAEMDDIHRQQAGRNTEIPSRLQEAHRKHLQATEQAADAESRQNELRLQHAVAAERARAAAERHAAARQAQRRRRRIAKEAEAATAAASILAAVADRVSGRIRPTLEADVSQMLDRLSDGRYSRVRFGEDFSCEVEDDGRFHPLETLSGGERDLVALAVRLALGASVSDRSGSGPDFLILDECFGSQDAERQTAIVNALRHLEDSHRQILIISHVPGVRDKVDRTVTVAAHLEDGVRTAEIH